MLYKPVSEYNKAGSSHLLPSPQLLSQSLTAGVYLLPSCQPQINEGATPAVYALLLPTSPLTVPPNPGPSILDSVWGSKIVTRIIHWWNEVDYMFLWW